MEFWIFFDFLKTFRRLDPPWNTGQRSFRKIFTKTCWKHVWTFLGTILVTFGNLEFFCFFENIWKTRPSMEHFAKKKFPKKVPQNMFKTLLDILGTFWAFLEFWIFFKLSKNISKTRPSMGHWAKKIFRKIYPKTYSKQVSTLLGTILGIFGILIFFWFFENISKTRPSMEHWAKKIFNKITPKHVQNTFGQFGNNFGRFWFFENFLKTFRWLDTPWNTWQKFYSKKLPQNLFKTCLDNLWTNLGVFAILKLFKFY